MDSHEQSAGGDTRGEADENRLLAAFCDLYIEDRMEGREHPLGHYLELFPAVADEVAAEYLELKRYERKTSTGGNRGEAPIGKAESVGPFLLERELGRGGQSTVWLATDTRLDRPVALKLLHGSRGESANDVGRLQREAAILSRLNHPAIATVLEAGVESGRPFIAMQFVPGRPLADVIAHPEENSELLSTLGGGQRRPSPASSTSIRQALGFFERVARALHVAHEVGVVHRDLKPANIMVSDGGEPVILDFGLASSTEPALVTLTQSGDVFGTPAYMAPEQVRGETSRVDRRTDVYALGATLYEFVAGRLPHVAPTRESLFRAILADDPDPVRKWKPEAPAELDIVIATAMDKDPSRRYATAEDLADELHRVRERTPIRARPAGPILRMRRLAERNPGLATGVLIGFLALTVGLAIALRSAREARRSATEERLAKQDAVEQLNRFERMSDAALARRLIEAEEELWPRRAERIDAMDSWIAEATELLGRRTRHREERDRLRALAGPYSEADRAADETLRKSYFPDLFDAIDEVDVRIFPVEFSLLTMRKEIAAIEGRLEAGDDDLRLERRFDRLEDDIEDAEALHAELLRKRADLESDPRRRERLTLGIDRASEWRHDVLLRLEHDLANLGTLVPLVRERRRLAAVVAEATLEDAAEAWRLCLDDIAKHPMYGGSEALGEAGYREWLTDLEPQLGLIPLGRDLRSSLWEFWVFETGPRPPWKTTSGVDGEIDLATVPADADHGMVLILVPGGTFRMGPVSAPGSPSTQFEMTIGPFFLAKYETTQGQWARAFATNPSRLQRATRQLGPMSKIELHDRFPVTDVSQEEARRAARALGLALPTEAQWECAARAGTTTKWWTGDEAASIFAAKAGNVADASLRRARGQRPVLHDDGWFCFAPVGTFAPNPFGFHEVIGNVFEWTRDRFGTYPFPSSDDGAHPWPSTTDRVMRGGSFLSPLQATTSWVRDGRQAYETTWDVGVRFSRPIDR